MANIGNVTGNTIGSLTTAGSISVASNNGSTMEVYGVYYFPSVVANVSIMLAVSRPSAPEV